MKYKQAAKDISGVINTFLILNGGYENRYLTYVRGVVHKHLPGTLEWCTPTKQNLLGDVKSALSEDVYEHVKKILEKYNIPDCCFQTIHIGSSRYQTNIVFTEAYSLS